MASGFKGVVGAMLAASLLASSTGAVAAASAPIAAPIAQVSPWAALSAMSGGASAAALCGAAAVTAAAQTPGGCVLPALDAAPPVAQAGPPPQPIPVPPIESPGGFGVGVDPLVLALGAVAAAGILYLVLRHHKSNSPA